MTPIGRRLRLLVISIGNLKSPTLPNKAREKLVLLCYRQTLLVIEHPTLQQTCCSVVNPIVVLIFHALLDYSSDFERDKLVALRKRSYVLNFLFFSIASAHTSQLVAASILHTTWWFKACVKQTERNASKVKGDVCYLSARMPCECLSLQWVRDAGYEDAVQAWDQEIKL